MVQKSMKEIRHDLVWLLKDRDNNAAKMTILQELEAVKGGRKA